MLGSKAFAPSDTGLLCTACSRISALLRSVLNMCHWHIAPLASYYSILTQTTSVKKQKNYNICKNSPLLNFGSNHVDFGGISMPASATANSSAMEVGYMEKATASFCCVSFT